MRITLLAIALSIITPSIAQEGVTLKTNDNGNKYLQEVIDLPGQSKDAIYTAAYTWFAKNFNDSNTVIKHSDKDQGIIVGNGTASIYFTYNTMNINVPINGTLNYNIQVDVKGNKVRFTLDDIKYSSKEQPHISSPLGYFYPTQEMKDATLKLYKDQYKKDKKAIKLFQESMEMYNKITQKSELILKNNYSSFKNAMATTSPIKDDW